MSRLVDACEWPTEGFCGMMLTAPVKGTVDQVYSAANAEEEIKLFVNSKDAKVVPVEGGQHFLSASNPKEVEPAVVEFLQKWA